MNRKFSAVLPGFVAGVLNGFFGAGGGLLVVPMLQSRGLPPRQAHATSLAVILPLSALTAALYLLQGVPVSWSQLGLLLPLGLAGAAAGAFLLKRIPAGLLKRIFGLVMVAAAIRLLLR